MITIWTKKNIFEIDCENCWKTINNSMFLTTSINVNKIFLIFDIFSLTNNCYCDFLIKIFIFIFNSLLFLKNFVLRLKNFEKFWLLLLIVSFISIIICEINVFVTTIFFVNFLINFKTFFWLRIFLSLILFFFEF